MATVTIEMNEEGWDSTVKDIVDLVCVPMMEAVAAACNQADGLEGGGTEISEDGTETAKDKAPGYEAGTDGGKPLTKHDYRATCITATNSAMAANARNNTLVNNLYKAVDGVNGGG